MAIYTISITEEFADTVRRLKARDFALYNRLARKIGELQINPYFRKPLSNELKGSFRVHVGQFVLRYRIDESVKDILLISFVHHDIAYR